MVDDGLLSKDYLKYRQKYMAVFDIETAEEPSEKESIKAIQKVISIGCSTNIPGCEKKWFCRKSSSPEHGQEMIDNFMKYLEFLHEELQQYVPKPILEALSKLELEVGDAKFSKYNAGKMKMINQLKKYKKLNVFGFNSGKSTLKLILFNVLSAKYDLKVIIGHILEYAGVKNFSAIKRGSQYLSISIGDICFKDVLSFTSPCSLEKYLKQWKATAQKGIYPYSHFSCIEEIEACTEFPTHDSFYNHIKKVFIFKYTVYLY